MSSLVATTLGLALYAAALLPVIWAAFGSRVRPAIAVYATFLLALAVYHTGIFQRSSLAPADMDVRAAASTNDTQCRQILDLARESGLGVDRTDPGAPRITGAGADQLPAEIRDVLLDCFERQAGAPSAGAIAGEAA
jgi:hypothetical protein